MTAPPPDVLDRLPHRPPFRFLSHVEELAPRSHASGCWVVTGEEVFLEGHFPGQPIVPGVLIAEALAQLAGLIVGADDVGCRFDGRLAQVEIRFKGAVRPPASIALHAELCRALGSVFQFDVEASHLDQRVAEGTLVLSDVSPRT